jgi:hypothetical protein
MTISPPRAANGDLPLREPASAAAAVRNDDGGGAYVRDCPILDLVRLDGPVAMVTGRSTDERC